MGTIPPRFLCRIEKEGSVRSMLGERQDRIQHATKVMSAEDEQTEIIVCESCGRRRGSSTTLFRWSGKYVIPFTDQ
jgi:hypothetical protein